MHPRERKCLQKACGLTAVTALTVSNRSQGIVPMIAKSQLSCRSEHQAGESWRYSLCGDARHKGTLSVLSLQKLKGSPQGGPSYCGSLLCGQGSYCLSRGIRKPPEQLRGVWILWEGGPLDTSKPTYRTVYNGLGSIGRALA